MNIFTNIASVGLFLLIRWSEKRYSTIPDPSTGEKLTERNKKFEWKKMFELPWVFWCIMAFTMFQTSSALVFSQNATELAEQRFKTDAITAGWYSAVLQYAGFFFVPLVGLFIDIQGQRLTSSKFTSIMRRLEAQRANPVCKVIVCGGGCFLAMALLCFSPGEKGTAAAFGIYAVAFNLGPTTIIDSIRTAMWHQSVFGSAYGMKVTINNA